MSDIKKILLLFFYELKYLILRKKYMAGIEITERCNLRCRQCYFKKSLKEEEDIPIFLWEKKFEKYRKMGIRFVGFTGGEPSLRYDILKLAEKYFPLIFVHTNGQIKIPKEYKHRILLSLDGLYKKNDKVRGVGSFERAIKNYKGDKRVIACCALSKINYSGKRGLRDFISFLKKIKICGATFDFYTPEIGGNDDLVLEKRQKREIGEVLLEELKRKDNILLMAKGRIKRLMKARPFTRCPLRKKILVFSVDGRNKKCFNEKFDCSLCGCWPNYYVPIYKPKDWILNKFLIYKFLLKNDIYNC